MAEEKRVFESDDLEYEDRNNQEIIDEDIQKVNEFREAKANEPAMSNGENCGIVEFEGKRINTCEGEQIVEEGYNNPDL